jgi:hypothetical protein
MGVGRRLKMLKVDIEEGNVAMKHSSVDVWNIEQATIEKEIEIKKAVVLYVQPGVHVTSGQKEGGF